MSRTLESITAALTASVLFCTSRDGTVTESRLREARDLWRNVGVTSYSIEVRLTDGRELERRVEVDVRDGEIVHGSFQERGDERELNETQAHPYTVDGLFRILALELENDRGPFVRAWFDPEWGYPELIELGPSPDGPAQARSRLLRVERFEPRSP